MSWLCSVCQKSFSRKDSMQRHVMSKHRKAGHPIPNSFNVFTEMSAVSLRAFFHLHDCRNDRVWKKRPGFGLCCNKLQRPFTLPWRGSFDIIHSGSPRIQKC